MSTWCSLRRVLQINRPGTFIFADSMFKKKRDFPNLQITSGHNWIHCKPLQSHECNHQSRLGRKHRFVHGKTMWRNIWKNQRQVKPQKALQGAPGSPSKGTHHSRANLACARPHSLGLSAHNLPHDVDVSFFFMVVFYKLFCRLRRSDLFLHFCPLFLLQASNGPERSFQSLPSQWDQWAPSFRYVLHVFNQAFVGG